MSKIAFIFIVSSFLSSARSQTWTGPNQLQPVHGLYVKPSSDGTTGDLYVAASEDSGTKAQWLTDQPVNFLPASTPQAVAGHAIPVAYPSYPTHDESSTTQKRAVISPSVAPVQYAYALPFNPTEGAQLPYPYAIPTSSTPETSATQCEKAPAPAPATTSVPYNPFQILYPHMMHAYANAKNVLKESGMSDDKASSVIPQASPFWSNSYSYPYPMSYVMMDPSAWAQLQPAQPTTCTKNAATTESSTK